MGNFRQGGSRGSFGGDRGGRPSFGGRKSFGGGFGSRGGSDRGAPMMHKAVCDECSQECEVPFRPTEGKPVYCRACFAGKDEGSSRGGDRGGRSERPSYGARPDAGNEQIKKQLGEINAKLDQILGLIGGKEE